MEKPCFQGPSNLKAGTPSSVRPATVQPYPEPSGSDCPSLPPATSPEQVKRGHTHEGEGGTGSGASKGPPRRNSEEGSGAHGNPGRNFKKMERISSGCNVTMGSVSLRNLGRRGSGGTRPPPWLGNKQKARRGLGECGLWPKVCRRELKLWTALHVTKSEVVT